MSPRYRMAKGIMVAVALLAPLVIGAAEPSVPSPEASPLGRYIIVLKEPERTPKGANEPDVSKHGGKEKGRWGRRRVVELPPAAIEALRKDPSILFITRVNTGNGETAEEYTTSSDESGAQTDAVAVPPTWDSGEYFYDSSGNIKSIGSDSYVYDKVSRLAKATVNGKVETYQYDSYGNMLEHTTDGVRLETPADALTNRSNGLSYDVAGNQTISYGALQRYEYDAVNMMVAKHDWFNVTDRYIYTVDDERIGSDRSGEWKWVIRDFGGKPLTEFSSGPTDWLWLEDFYYRDGLLVASRRPAAWGANRHFHLDHLGTPRLITNTLGQKISAHDYYPFGREQTLVSQEYTNWGYDRPSPLKYTGHERDFMSRNDPNDTRYLDYMHARFYNPNAGRFLSVDPALNMKRVMQKPQGWNRFTYVENNPINARDPDGRAIDIVLDAAFIVADVADIASTLIAGDRTTGMQWAALGGDVVGAAVPFLTGVGAAIKVANKADDVAKTAVYVSRAADNAVQYVGITNNLTRRTAEHAATKGIQITSLKGFEKLGRADARAVEQTLIEIHKLAKDGGTLMNKINSIAKTNKKYAESLERGYKLLNEAGYLVK